MKDLPAGDRLRRVTTIPDGSAGARAAVGRVGSDLILPQFSGAGVMAK